MSMRRRSPGGPGRRRQPCSSFRQRAFRWRSFGAATISGRRSAGSRPRHGARWRMRRTLLAAGVAGAVIAVEWLRFEQPLVAPARATVLVVLPMAAAAFPTVRLRVVGSVVAAVVAVRLAYGGW